MSKAIRDHLRDFIAIVGLLVIGLLATYVIVQNQRLRIPLLEEKPFELKADLSTAQAVTPGQGQTVRVAGVRVGDISSVDYQEGHAVVTMAIDRKFLPVLQGRDDPAPPEDRPQGHVPRSSTRVELRTRTSNADEYQNGGEIPVANTAPDTNVDQILSALDGDTRSYLKAAHGRRGRGPQRSRQGPRQGPGQPWAAQTASSRI